MILDWFLAVALAASPPIITVPSGSIILPNAGATIAGISIAESGAGPTVQFTTTVTATADLTATGTGVTGSGTSAITIAGTSAQTNTALATLAIDETCAERCTDVITINTHDASNNAAPQQQIAIVADAGKYLTFSTLAAAQARSQAQAQAVGEDGVHTIYEWEVDPTVTGAAVRVSATASSCLDRVVLPNAVQIVATFSGSITGNILTAPSSPALSRGLFLGGNNILPVTSIVSGSGTTWLLNKTYASSVGSETMTAVTTYCNPAVLPNAGLTSAEQSALVTAPNAGFSAPTVSNGVVTP